MDLSRAGPGSVGRGDKCRDYGLFGLEPPVRPTLFCTYYDLQFFLYIDSQVISASCLLDVTHMYTVWCPVRFLTPPPPRARHDLAWAR